MSTRLTYCTLDEMISSPGNEKFTTLSLAMPDTRLTEERLRHYLDANQVMRERMCLALLPLLGPYTREQPRRPKGGPDGARDIECIFQGRTSAWGAVGFRNGGGNDTDARRDAETKFKADCNNAIQENPSLACFVFFTNVDLTPGIKDSLKAFAAAKGLSFVEIFDFERLRNALDSAEGLLARLQYLGITMTSEEQIALISKFGTQLQNAVTARFDRVERTLTEMERFLDFQKPILRIDVYIELDQPTVSTKIGHEAVLIRLHGLHDLDKHLGILCVNSTIHKYSTTQLVCTATAWNSEQLAKTLTLGPCIGQSNSVLATYAEISLTNGGHRIRIADLTVIGIEALVTAGLRDKVKSVRIDANGYVLFSCGSTISNFSGEMKWPSDITKDMTDRVWSVLVPIKRRNLLFDPVTLSGTFQQIGQVE